VAVTYSLGSLGVLANQQQAVANVELPDQSCQGGQQFSEGHAARTNRQMLCQNPDLSHSYYTIDATRWRDGQKPPLLAVWP
jgi:hypothetical protein